MAKRKKASGGAGIGLILTLIFFVLTTFIAGTVAYFGYEEIEGHKAKAVDAKKKQDEAEARYREERVRKVMLRIAMGVEDTEKDRVLLVQELETFRPQIKDEYDRMKTALIGVVPEIPDPKDPAKTVSAFYWPLLNMSNKDIQEFARDPETGQTKEPAALAADPATRPVKVLPDMIALHEDKRKAAEQARRDAEAKAADAETRVAAATTDKGKIEMQFSDALIKIQAETKDKYTKLDTNFNDLVRKHSNDAKNATDRVRDLGAADNAKADQIAALNAKIQQITELLNKFQDQSASTSRLNAVGVDFTNLEEKKGEVFRKEEAGYVTINIGSNKRLKPQVTFLVVGADVSWLTLIEREEALKRSSYRTDRQPFEDNPYVKAGIEVVEITGPDRARCKILYENEPIRNPVQARDQIFNLSWQPDEEIRIAFAGIIDLDGDGLDNNEDFLRMLERQGVVVDEYLKMKPLDFVKRDGRGMSLRTKYLVIAPDPRLDSVPGNINAPPQQSAQVGAALAAMSEIKARARELGVQMIEARKFLAMIGYKLPKNPLPPQYGSSAYFGDLSAPPMPVEPKKDGN